MDRWRAGCRASEWESLRNAALVCPERLRCTGSAGFYGYRVGRLLEALHLGAGNQVDAGSPRGVDQDFMQGAAVDPNRLDRLALEHLVGHRTGQRPSAFGAYRHDVDAGTARHHSGQKSERTQIRHGIERQHDAGAHRAKFLDTFEDRDLVAAAGEMKSRREPADARTCNNDMDSRVLLWIAGV